MKSADRSRASTAARAHSPKQHTGRRPWPLIALGVACLALVLIVGLRRATERDAYAKPEQKVYSAASDTFEPMAVTSNQAGKLDPPGIASPLRLFAVRPGASSHEGIAVLGALEESSRTYVAGALLENGARLKDLYADHVVLIRGGTNYTLYLPQKGRSDPTGQSRCPRVDDRRFSASAAANDSTASASQRCRTCRACL